MQILVLGMHGAGASMMSRLLKLAGCHFGPEGAHVGPHVVDPEGAWERTDIKQINDDLFSLEDADWDIVDSLDMNAAKQDTVERYRAQMRRIISELDDHRPWLIKEPRVCLLLPLLRPLLEKPIVVLVLRNPVEIAFSLHAKHDMSIAVGLALWEYYIVNLFQSAVGLPLVVARHDQLIARPVKEFNRIITELENFGVAPLRHPSATEVESFIDPKFCQNTLDIESASHLTGHQSKLLSILAGLDGGTMPPLDVDLSLVAREYLAEYGQRRRMDNKRADEEQIINSIMNLLENMQASIARLEISIASQEQRVRTMSNALHNDLLEAKENIFYVHDVSESERLALIRSVEEIVPRLLHKREISMRNVASQDFDTTISLVALRSILDNLEATHDSIRWKLGNMTVNAIEKILFRKRSELGLERAIRLLRQHVGK